MNKDDIINVTGIPMNLHVDDATVITDNFALGTSMDTDLEDCSARGEFIKKELVQFSWCPICKNSLAEDYRAPGERPERNVERNVKRRSSAVYALGCGHRFHSGCLLDHLEGYESHVTLLNEVNNQTVARVARVPRQTIMIDEVLRAGETSGIACPEPTCFKRCYTAQEHMLLEYFIGEENERVPRGDLSQFDSSIYTGEDPPPEEIPCVGSSCNISGGKRKTKNKVKKKKQVKKQTKKKKQKGKKTRGKISKK